MAKTIYDLLRTSSREDLSRILCDSIDDCDDCPGYMFCHPERQHVQERQGEPYHNGLWHYLGRPAAELTGNDDYD